MTAKSENNSHSSWFVDNAPRHQRGIGDAVAPEKRNPTDHTDDVGRPERDRAEQKKCHLPGQASNMEGQIIGNGEPDHQGERPM